MSKTVEKLAHRAGVLVDWIDAMDRPQRVSRVALSRILYALGYPCGNEREVERTLDQLSATRNQKPQGLITCDADMPITLDEVKGAQARLVLEDGTNHDIRLTRFDGGPVQLPPLSQPGYHELHADDRIITLAVAPKRCFTLADVALGEKLWGLTAQLYGLRRQGDGKIGDTTALAMLARDAAANGADAIAISPIHALFSARPDKFSPYASSNKLFLNPLLADPECVFGQRGVDMPLAGAPASDSLIDWPKAAQQKLTLLRRVFQSFRLENTDDALAQSFLRFRQAGGEMLENHAKFEAIHAAMVQRDPFNDGYQTWPEAYARPENAGVAEFAAEHEVEVTFHVFLQWLADESFCKAQNMAREAGMRIGLISDFAVGIEPGGSYAWSRPGDVLPNLMIGAPPDLFNSDGQNWGLTTFSPRALVERDFQPFIETLRAAMRHAGGVRIDHILGLKRLWVIPKGVSGRDGAYLTYPFEDLLRLTRLESFRHRTIVIGEDLGTVPAGFRETLSQSRIAGMDVLWFSRDKQSFLDPKQWRLDAVAMTSTHDLPTAAGWWRGADIRFRAESGLSSNESQEEAEREKDRAALKQAFADADIFTESANSEDESFVDDAIAFVAKSPAPLVLVPLEDMLGLEDQPNVPGTIDTHPNWRRRYPIVADHVFDAPQTLARAKTLSQR